MDSSAPPQPPPQSYCPCGNLACPCGDGACDLGSCSTCGFHTTSVCKRCGADGRMEYEGCTCANSSSGEDDERNMQECADAPPDAPPDADGHAEPSWVRAFLAPWRGGGAAPWGTRVSGTYSLLQFNVDRRPCALERVRWVLSVDRSGSMNEACKDGRTKAEQIVHTLRNLFAYLRAPPPPGSAGSHQPEHVVFLHSFDDRIETPLVGADPRQLSEKELEIALKGLAPRGMTDIAAALRRASTAVLTPALEAGEHAVHILLTDGHVTIGECRQERLKAIVLGTAPMPDGRQGGVRNAFLGYGSQHCAHLLQALASVEGGAYHFVDSLEHAGMVYGEIVHNALFEQGHDAKIEVEDGEVYDPKRGLWVNQLDMGVFVSEDQKSWLVRATGTSPRATIRYRRTGKAEAEEVVVAQPGEAHASAFVYAWARQRCLEVMAEARRVMDAGHPEVQLEAVPGPLAHSVLDMAKNKIWAAVVPLLDAHPSLINALPAPRHYRLIHHAAKQGNLAMLKELVARDARMLPTSDGVDALTLAAAHPGCRAYLESLGKPSRTTVLSQLDALLTEMRASAERASDEGMQARYRQLADDMYIARLSLSATDKSLGTMYLGARAVSQSEQRAYRIGDVSELQERQTAAGQVFRNLTGNYTVSGPGAAVQASIGAAEVMEACMGDNGPG
jgi:hypothetical protein